MEDKDIKQFQEDTEKGNPLCLRGKDRTFLSNCKDSPSRYYNLNIVRILRNLML